MHAPSASTNWPKPGLVHHSDRGVQYASQDYATELQQHGIRISMSRTASPYDNAQAESFIKTLKYEEVYRTEYRSLEDARASIGEFLEKIYNRERLHSALGYCPPLEFERHLRAPKRWGQDRHEFSEAWGIYRSDDVCFTGSKRFGSLPVLIGLDEFQPVIPWQVALQQSLLPLRRPRAILQN